MGQVVQEGRPAAYVVFMLKSSSNDHPLHCESNGFPAGGLFQQPARVLYEENEKERIGSCGCW